jgi:Tfp pilus assembly protein PilO
MEEKSVNTAEYIKIIKESPEKKKTYIFFGFSVFVMIVLTVFAIRPTILTITRIDKEIKEKTQINALLESKMNTLNDLDSQYMEVKKEIGDLELIFPGDDNYSLLMSNVDAIAARNGFTLTSVNFDEYKNDSYSLGTRVLVPKLMRVSVKGRESNLINLLRDFEDLPMYPVVDLVSYSTQLDKDGLNAFTMSLRIYNIENDKFYK